MPAERGPAVRVTRGGGLYAIESADEQYLYYAKGSPGYGIWRMPLSGLNETKVLPARVGWGDWALFPSGIYYRAFDVVEGASRVNAGEGSDRLAGHMDHTIQFLDFESGQVTELFRKQGAFELGWLTVSPDEEWVLYCERPLRTSELMLVENLR